MTHRWIAAEDVLGALTRLRARNEDGESEMSRIGPACLIFSLAGWILVLLVAVFLPGGHPPAIAYVFVPVALTTIAVSSVGMAVGVRSIRRRSEPGLVDYGALVGNALVVACVIVWAVAAIRGQP